MGHMGKLEKELMALEEIWLETMWSRGYAMTMLGHRSSSLSPVLLGNFLANSLADIHRRIATASTWWIKLQTASNDALTFLGRDFKLAEKILSYDSVFLFTPLKLTSTSMFLWAAQKKNQNDSKRFKIILKDEQALTGHGSDSTMFI